MSESVQIKLLPIGKTLTVPRGTPLQDVLFAPGVEFPCGGQGRCKGCRIKVRSGSLPITAEDERLFSSAELADNSRLACRARAESDLTIELAQWEATILVDDSRFDFTPRAGFGVAIDLGTTTLAAQLLDLSSGHLLAVRTALNAQARHGADIMSRIEFATQVGGQAVLAKLIRDQLGGLVLELIDTAGIAAGDLRKVVIAGNMVMHHLFSGIDVEPLSRHPFEAQHDGLQEFPAKGLNWNLNHETEISFLPCLGGFVGSDILAGIIATQMHQRQSLAALIDLGTNGEIVVGNCQRMLCASTAAGPAFEGARILCGMRAATGAISEVHVTEGRLHCHVLGNIAARGICGSGLVDAVACGLDLDLIQSSGRLVNGVLALAPEVALKQSDLRELQLAKGAIAAGLRILLRQWGASLDELSIIYLAGAFGNYINRVSAHRIGLLNVPPEKVSPAGNTALLGAKLALFESPWEQDRYDFIRLRTQHVRLNEDPQFMDIFVDEMAFPGRPRCADGGHLAPRAGDHSVKR